MAPHRSSILLRTLCAAGLLVALGSIARPALAAPVFGFREDWTGTSTHGWLGGGGSGVVISNPGTGGVDGSGDGFLLLSLANAGNFGARSSGSEYVGNWSLAGIEQVRVAVNDVGATDALELHFCIGNTSNFWQYNQGFIPPNGVWKDYVIGLSDPNQFTQILSSGSFAQALQSTDRILIRHDLAPFVQNPDPGVGDFGIDRLILTAVATPARQSTWGKIKSLYR